MAQYVRRTLREGLFGWQVPDCTVTVTDCGYVASGTTAADFRKLTPVVLMRALEQAGTVVCEPVVRVSLEVPARSIGTVLPVLSRLGAAVETPLPAGELAVVEALLRSDAVDELQRELAGLTRGEGVLESTFAGYRPVGGEPPTRRPRSANG